MSHTQSRTCCTPCYLRVRNYCRVHNCCTVHAQASQACTYYSTNTLSVPCCIWSALATAASEVLVILAFGRIYKVAIMLTGPAAEHTFCQHIAPSLLAILFSGSKFDIQCVCEASIPSKLAVNPCQVCSCKPSQTSNQFLQGSLVRRPVLQRS